MTQARMATDPKKRRELLADVQKRVLDLAPVLYLYSAHGFDVHRAHVRGYAPSRLSRAGLAGPWLEK